MREAESGWWQGDEQDVEGGRERRLTFQRSLFRRTARCSLGLSVLMNEEAEEEGVESGMVDG